MDNQIKYTEEDALEAVENNDEQKAFDIYIELIDALTDEDIDEDGMVSLELISCKGDFPEFRRYSGKKIPYKTWVDDFFTEEHAKQLKKVIEDVMDILYEGAWVSWDMSTHPRAYLPD